MTTKNGTFPILLTSLDPDSSTQDFPRIFSATVESRENENALWQDVSEEILFTTFLNTTFDEINSTETDVKANQKRSINDAVSKNITVVLENLLKNYEKSQLPTHGKGELGYIYFNI